MSTCPSCRSSDVIDFTLAPAGEPMTLRHCRACEHHWWESEHSGGEIVLRDVLSRIAMA